jgi:hypothetical protein
MNSFQIVAVLPIIRGGLLERGSSHVPDTGKGNEPSSLSQHSPADQDDYEQIDLNKELTTIHDQPT